MPRHRLLLTLLSASFFVAGFVEPFTARPDDLHSLLSLLHIVVIAVLLYLWCKADAAARNTVPRQGAAVFAAIFPLLGVPFYLLRSRPWRQALVHVGIAIALLVLFVVLAAVGTLLAEQVIGA